MANEGVPYYAPLAADTPVADHTAAKIIANTDIAGSFTRGLAAMGQIAAANKRAQLEAEQMATDAALKSRQLDIQRENNLLDYDVGIKSADALANYRNTMAEINSDPTNPLGRIGKINIAREKMATLADFNKRLNNYGLLESNVTNPVQFYANYQKLSDEFQFADDMPEIKNALGALKIRTEQHTLPLRDGHYDEDGTFVLSGETKPRPVGYVMDNLADPMKRDETMALIEANGLTVKLPARKTDIDVTGSKERNFITEWLFGKPTQKQTVTETTLSPSISRYAKMAASVDFSRGKPRTPAAGVVVPNDATGLPTGITTASVDEAAATMAAEKEPLFAPTETDKELARARRAAAKPGANIEMIKSILQGKGIDPNLLDSE